MGNIEQTKILDDKKISIALMASFVVLTVQYFILIYFNLLGTTDASSIQLISKVLVAIIFLYALPAVWKRSKIKFIASYFIGFFLFLLHYWIFPENSVHIQGLVFPFFFMCLPAFVYSISLSDWNVLKEIMKKASFIVFIFGLILGLLVFAGKVSIGDYSMSLSYYMLLPMIIYLDELFDKPSLKMLFPVIVILLIILSLGSRGAILCIGIFAFLKIIRFNLKQNYTRFLTYSILFVTAASVLVIYFDSILGHINSTLLNYGIGSRSIYLFLSKGVYLSGREQLYQNVIKEILNNPLLGIGLAGDRQVIGGGYVHNLFLEVLANFGIVLGAILILILVLLVFRVLFIKDKDKYNMLIVWLSLGLVPLMVSGSYLTDINFWILMGLMANLIFISKTHLFIK